MYAVNEKPASSTRPKSRGAPEVKKTLDSLVHGNDRRDAPEDSSLRSE